MKYFIVALFLVNIISLAESGPWDRNKTHGRPLGDEDRFNKSRYSGNCSHPWFNSTLEEFNNTFGFVPPLEKFQKFWKFLKNFFNESYGDFNETIGFPFPRKDHRRPGDGGRGLKPGSVRMAPPSNLDDVTSVPQNPGHRPSPPPPYDNGNFSGKSPPPRKDGSRPSSPSYDGNFPRKSPPPPFDDSNFSGKSPPPRKDGSRPSSLSYDGNFSRKSPPPSYDNGNFSRKSPPPPYDNGNFSGKNPPPRQGGGRP